MAKPTSAELIVGDSSLTKKALNALHSYFDNPSKEAREVAGEALRVTGVQSRIIASQTNRAAVILGTAKQMGLSGDALAPLWKELTSTDARKFLPPPASEGSSGALRSVA